MRYLLTFIIPLLLVQSASAVGFQDVVITFQPEYPKPDSVVKASLQTFSYNLQGVPIQWFIGDLLVQEGIGLTSIELTTPLLGESLEISANVGAVAQARRTLLPTTVDILWEAQTYTPKWFKGRALPVDSAQITALAIPHLGTTVDPQQLIYNWYKDARFLAGLSGAGKSTLYTSAPSAYDDYNLSVEVSSTQGVILGSSGVHITTIEPELVLYGVSPLLGTTFFNALTRQTGVLPRIEGSLIAMPYYFSIQDPQDLTYTWRISGAQYARSAKQNQLTLTNTQDAGASITLSAQHPKKLLQSTSLSYQTTSTNRTNNTSNQDTTYLSPFGNPDN